MQTPDTHEKGRPTAAFTLIEMPFGNLRAWGERKRSAFTLIEMLVVLALIGILTGLLSVVFVKARRTSRQVQCTSNLNEIGKALTSFIMDTSGAYPPLYSDDEGNVVTTAWDGANGMPWWARVYQQIEGAPLDRDPTTKEALELGKVLPKGMDVFHCPLAPGLPNADPVNTNMQNVVALDGGMSYGLNYDVKQSDGTPYRCVDKTNAAYPGLANPPTGAADRAADSYYLSKIDSRPEFILISEGDAVNGTGSRIRCDATSDASNRAPVVGRHDGYANVLYASGRVALERVDPPSGEGYLLNENTPLWTLVDD